MAAIRSTSPAESRPRQAPVWLPWVTAPVFFLLPIGGCGIAASRRPPLEVAAAPEPVLPGPAEPVLPMVRAVTAAR